MTNCRAAFVPDAPIMPAAGLRTISLIAGPPRKPVAVIKVLTCCAEPSLGILPRTHHSRLADYFNQP